MNNKLALILGLALMLMASFVVAQDYEESDVGCTPEEVGTEGVGIECVPSYWCFDKPFAWPGTPDIIGKPGQTITFNGKDPAATYVWTLRDGYNKIIQGPSGSPFVVKLPLKCGVGYTVEWTATVKHSDGEACVNKGCITIWVPCICVKCPEFPNYCTGIQPDPYPVTVTVPAPYTLEWFIDGVAKGTGNAPTGWDTLPVGTHTIVMKLKLAGVTIKTCTDTVVVHPTPVGGASWTSS